MFCFRKYWKAGMLFLILSLLPIWNLGFSLDLDAPRPVYAGTCPHDPEGGGPSGVTLDECVTSTHFIAYYTTDVADGSHRILSEAQAQFVIDNLEVAWDRYVNDADFDFRVPKNTDVEPLEVWIHDISGLGVTASSWNHMSLDAGYVRDCDPVGSPTGGNCLQSKATPLHELLHRVQYKYTGFSEEKTTAGNFAVEGHAKFMEDEVFADLDSASGTQYQLRSNGYLGDPNWDVTTASYNACFFWKYFTERYGTATDEPERGVDAVRHFWDESEVMGVGGVGTVNLALDSLGHPAVTFHSVFRDWIVANYTKDLDTVPAAKYGYIDDDDNPYSSVHKTVDVSAGTGDYSTSANQSVDRWGARYYQVRPTATCGAVSFDFERDSGTPVYHVLTIKDDELVDHWTSTSSDWSKTVVNDDYDEVVGIVGGYGTDTQVDVSYGCADLYVNIVDPTTLEPAFVGSILDPEKFLVRLEVTSTQSIKIEGLNAQDFDITVGTQAADIVLGAYIQSQYWLLVQAPIQTTAGDYNLTAAYGSASDTENTAVKYITVVYDDMLVIDRSGSMLLDGKLDAAKNAARLYTDATADGNMLGMTSFGADATLDYGLAVVNSTVRADVKGTIDAITTTLPELTSIGDGLSMGLADLELNGDEDHPCTVVLLSDGVQTAPSYWNDVKTGIIASPCVVDTIALGPDTDEVLLQEIANLTSGNYYYVPDENATLRAQGTSQLNGDWVNELAGTYEFAQGDVAGRSRLFELNGVATAGGGPYTHTVTVEDDVTEVVFFVNFASPGQHYMRLYNPDGVQIFERVHDGVRTEVDALHILYEVMTPTLQSGDWDVVVGTSTKAAGAQPEAALQGIPYLVGTSGNTHLTLHPFLGAPLASRLQGVRMPVLAALAGRTPILGATISATVMGPNGLFQMFPLFDDGEHGDGKANDGLYGNWFPLSIGLNSPGGEEDGLEGSYRVKFETDGVVGQIGARYAQLGFAIEKDADNDGDGMPNLWEDANGLDKNVDDAGEDPDLDELDNLGEYNNGTDPHDSDTDGGGENDGSEVILFGYDPLDPADDEIEAIEFVNASPHISATVLTFGVVVEYGRLRLFRSTSPDSGYLPVEENVDATGVYTDTGLTNDTTYYYKMMAVDVDSHRSAVASAGAATPKLDPFPPTNVGVLINDGAISTFLRDVTLSFFFEEPGETEDVAEVMVSNDAAFTGATWVSYTETLSWTLSSTLQYSDTAEVFVKFRDAALNESPDVAGDSILYEGHDVYLPLVLRNYTPQ